MRSALKLCAFILIAFLASCATTDGGGTVPVNMNCPFAGEPVDATVTATFEDTTVAFCCTKCLGKFDGMTDAEKREVVTKATTN